MSRAIVWVQLRPDHHPDQLYVQADLGAVQPVCRRFEELRFALQRRFDLLRRALLCERVRRSKVQRGFADHLVAVGRSKHGWRRWIAVNYRCPSRRKMASREESNRARYCSSLSLSLASIRLRSVMSREELKSTCLSSIMRG